jgi:hypothetical protein
MGKLPPYIDCAFRSCECNADTRASTNIHNAVAFFGLVLVEPPVAMHVENITQALFPAGYLGSVPIKGQ